MRESRSDPLRRIRPSGTGAPWGRWLGCSLTLGAPHMQNPADSGLSRRHLLIVAGASVVATSASSAMSAQDAPIPQDIPTGVPELPTTAKVSFSVNGMPRTLALDTRTTLLDALREHLHLTGTKKGCDHGQCGACTVHVNGRRVNACLSLAGTHAGDEITTIEGIGQPDALHPMQAAFVECDGYQCGYCTSGQIMSAVALLDEPVGPSNADVREAMSGNLCRCGAYQNIVAAIQIVRGKA